MPSLRGNAPKGRERAGQGFGIMHKSGGTLLEMNKITAVHYLSPALFVHYELLGVLIRHCSDHAYEEPQKAIAAAIKNKTLKRNN